MSDYDKAYYRTHDERTQKIHVLKKQAIRAEDSGQDSTLFHNEIARLRSEIAHDSEREILNEIKVTKSFGTKGYICSRGKNSWRIQIYTGEWMNGKRCRYFETIHGNRSNAERRLRELNQFENLEKKKRAQTNEQLVIENEELTKKLTGMWDENLLLEVKNIELKYPIYVLK